MLKKNQTDIRIKRKLKTICLIFFCAFSILQLKAQKADYFIGSARYSFIDYEKNTFLQTEENADFVSFYEKLDSLVKFGDRKLNILHFGGSHIQADIYTNQMRKRLTQLSPDMNAGRGLIFPAKMAQTNNPSNFNVSYTGNWKFSKCTKPGNDSLLGLTGFSVTTNDSICSITVDPNRDSLIHYTFNRARVFHGPTHYKLQIKTTDSIYEGTYNETFGYTEFQLSNDQDVIVIQLLKDTINDSFSLFGISIENDAPGIVYNSVGVNGAMLSSYLRCNLLPKHLRALSPDLVVFSIGTNEGNTLNFDSLSYINNYKELLDLVKTTLPNTAILLTVPNDCYYRKKYTNKNTSVIRDIIYALADEKNCGVWDFYEVMGGFNSAQTWYSNRLMNFDRIHFNREGYLLKGDLFFSAFLKSWEWHIEKYASIQQVEKSIELQAHATIQ